MFLNQFQNVGRALSTRGLVSSSSGNLSIRIGDKLIITRRGSNLGSLQEKDLIETGINKNDRATPMASVELPVHRAIYQKTQARAIVHAHPIHVIVISLIEKAISSSYLSEFYALKQVPVIGWGMEVKAGGLSEQIADALVDNHVVAVHGHGSFATGSILDEALNSTTALEEACKVLYMLKTLGASIK